MSIAEQQMFGIFLQAVSAGILNGGIYAVISMGLALVFGVVNIVNFAHGEFLMVGMYLTYWAFFLLKIDPHLSIFLCFIVLFCLGYITQKAVIERTFDKPFEGEVQIFVTVALSIIFVNGIQMLWSSDYRGLDIHYVSKGITLAGTFFLNLFKLGSFVITLIVSYLLYFFLTRTDVGRAMRAITENRGAAELLGIDVRKHYCLAFGIGAGMTGIGAALLAPTFYIYPGVGLIFVLKAFVIIVLGGMGSVSGAFVAALIIGIVESVGGILIGGAFTQVVIFAIFILTMLFKPTGLMGGRMI
jgi:branched-chain amino acid transport system permease protein